MGRRFDQNRCFVYLDSSKIVVLKIVVEHKERNSNITSVRNVDREVKEMKSVSPSRRHCLLHSHFKFRGVTDIGFVVFELDETDDVGAVIRIAIVHSFNAYHPSIFKSTD